MWVAVGLACLDIVPAFAVPDSLRFGQALRPGASVLWTSHNRFRLPSVIGGA
jgi:hypothetical protein